MLSILVPVYNFSVVDLVNDLNKQIIAGAITAEIIIVDDASSEFIEENSKIIHLDNVTYERLTNNIGRSAIRNYLLSKARYDYLLFIDCDAKISNPNFISNYLQCIKENKDVVCGGVKYEEAKPENRGLYFRWYYGKEREAITDRERNKCPHKSFSSFNFLIKKAVFEVIKFNEQLTKYGHEDTLLGIELKKQNIQITHINNALIHDGLEELDVFLQKTRQSIQNLKYLQNSYTDLDLLNNSIKLLNTTIKVQNLRLGWFFKLCYILFNKMILSNLRSKKPSLILFDFYKITYYFSL